MAESNFPMKRISGTVCNIEQHGNEDVFYLKTDKGEYITANMPCSFSANFGASIGDDLILAGFYDKEAKHLILDETHLGTRITDMLDSGVEITSFGDTPTSPTRPVYALWSRFGTSLGLVKVGFGATLIKPNQKTSDPVVNWGKELISQMGFKSSVRLVSPKAYRPKLKGYDAESFLNKNLPFMVKGKIGLKSAQKFLNNGGAIWRYNAHESVIMPYTETETYTSTWERKTGLPLNNFSPKQIIRPSLRRSFEFSEQLGLLAYNELPQYRTNIKNINGKVTKIDFKAETIHMPENLKGEDGLLNRHKRKAFAVAFAALAIAQKYGTAEISPFANLSYLPAFLGKAEDVTGRVIEAAQKRAEELSQKGKLSNLSPQEMIFEANKIAKSSRLSEAELKAFATIRDKIVKTHLDSKAPFVFKDGTKRMEAVKGLEKVFKRGAAYFDILRPTFEKAFEAIKVSAYNPKELENESVRWHAAKLYDIDLSQTVISNGNDVGAANRLYSAEMDRHGEKYETTESMLIEAEEKAMSYIKSPKIGIARFQSIMRLRLTADEKYNKGNAKTKEALITIKPKNGAALHNRHNKSKNTITPFRKK